MNKLTYIIFFFLLLAFIVPSCSKKDNCANCKGYITVGDEVLLVWTLDTFVTRFPNNKESDWCKLLKEIDGQPLIVNSIEIGKLNKFCE